MTQCEYISPEPIKMKDLITYRVGCKNGEYDYDWIIARGEVILKIACADGLFLVVLEDGKED